MKLTEKAIIAIKSNRKLINLLAVEADCHAGTIDRQIKENRENGELTKTATVDFVAKYTGIPVSEILEITK